MPFRGFFIVSGCSELSRKVLKDCTVTARSKIRGEWGTGKLKIYEKAAFSYIFVGGGVLVVVLVVLVVVLVVLGVVFLAPVTVAACRYCYLS